MNKTLEDILEDIKQSENYAVDVRYGEGLGADDTDIPQDERVIRISASPVGVLGSARTLYKGTLSSARQCDFKNTSFVLVSNPPSNEEIKEYGYYIWGTDGAIESLKERLEIIELPREQLDIM